MEKEKKVKTPDKMSFKEFEKMSRTFTQNEDWQFGLFKIVCQKCGSDKVECNGKLATENGYYGSYDVTSLLVVKCHGCGNAFTIKQTDGGSNNYCNCGE